MMIPPLPMASIEETDGGKESSLGSVAVAYLVNASTIVAGLEIERHELL